MQTLLAIHERQIAEHGGTLGIRDERALECITGLPGQHLPDIASLAAHYAISIVRNRPFVDGNKRVAYVAMETCLYLHWYTIDAYNQDCVVELESLAHHDISESDFVAWVRENAIALT
jgi:death-on-curing protein